MEERAAAWLFIENIARRTTASEEWKTETEENSIIAYWTPKKEIWTMLNWTNCHKTGRPGINQIIGNLLV